MQKKTHTHRPNTYFLKQLAEKGLRVDPKPLSWRNPDSKITCVALKRAAAALKRSAASIRSASARSRAEL